MSTRKGALEDSESFLSSEYENNTLKIDKRSDKVFINNELIDPKENKDILLEILEEKRSEMKDLKNSFLQDFQNSTVDDKKTRNKARKIGELSTDVKDLEDIINNY